MSMISRNLPEKAYTCKLWDHPKKIQSLNHFEVAAHQKPKIRDI